MINMNPKPLETKYTLDVIVDRDLIIEDETDLIECVIRQRYNRLKMRTT